MAVRRLTEEQPASFEFTPENLAWAKRKIEDYPEGRQASAVIPILWKAQAQHGGWLPEPAIRLVADMLEMPYIRVFEVATFYTMFQLQPVGTVAHINVCGTTPCMLRGSDEIVAICKKRIAAAPFELSDDGRFSWEEVECAGACVNAPMVQIGADTFEDLTAESFEALLDALDKGAAVTPGPQSARRASEPITGATSLRSEEKDEAPEGDAVAQADDKPDKGVDPTSPRAAEEQAGRPDPRGRVTVEAARGGGADRQDPSPVAPEPKTSGHTAKGDETGRQPDADERPGATGGPTPETTETEATAISGEGKDSPGEKSRERGAAPSDKGDADEAAQAAVEGPGASGAPASDDNDDDAQGGSASDAAASGDGRLADQVADTPSPEGSGEGVAAPSRDAEDATPSFSADAGASRSGGSAEVPAEGPPDQAAASRADSVGTRPRAIRREDVADADNLRRITGIGPVIEKTLHDLGVFTFAQIAEWDQSNKDWVNEYLAFKGRIDRENWVEQAQLIVTQSRDEA